MQEWLGTVGADSIDKIVDTREITYSSGDSDVSSYGMTALHYAAFYAQVELVEILLKAGAGMYHHYACLIGQTRHTKKKMDEGLVTWTTFL